MIPDEFTANTWMLIAIALAVLVVWGKFCYWLGNARVADLERHLWLNNIDPVDGEELDWNCDCETCRKEREEPT